jgi:DNA-binding MarR family transcriptional regulator
MSSDDAILSGRAAALLAALNPIENSIGLPLTLTLLAIAQNPGLSVNDLAERLEVPQQTASRYVASLQGRYSMPGRDLGPVPLISIEVSATDPRKRALKLSEAGVTRIRKLIETLTGIERTFNG